MEQGTIVAVWGENKTKHLKRDKKLTRTARTKVHHK
jgi:hypothetical protein